MGSLERSTILAHFGDRRTDRPKPGSAKQLYPVPRHIANSSNGSNHTRVNGDPDTWNRNN